MMTGGGGQAELVTSSYAHAQTMATRCLSDALDAKSAAGVSLRQIAGRLGYKSAVVVSQMRTGRMPIPIDRAVEIAKMVDIDPAKFLMLVLEQRHPDVDFTEALNTGTMSSVDKPLRSGVARILVELEALADKPIDELSSEQISVLREVVADQRPRRRWLGISEITLVDLIRRVRPDYARDGIGPAESAAIEQSLKARA